MPDRITEILSMFDEANALYERRAALTGHDAETTARFLDGEVDLWLRDVLMNEWHFEHLEVRTLLEAMARSTTDLDELAECVKVHVDGQRELLQYVVDGKHLVELDVSLEVVPAGSRRAAHELGVNESVWEAAAARLKSIDPNAYWLLIAAAWAEQIDNAEGDATTLACIRHDLRDQPEIRARLVTFGHAVDSFPVQTEEEFYTAVRAGGAA